MSGRALAPAPPSAQPLAVPGLGVLRRRLSVGEANDPLEREAERRAGEIVAAPAPVRHGIMPDRGGVTLRRACARCEDEERKTLRRSAVGAAPATAPPAVASALAQGGTPLPEGVRAFMEPRFGADFSGVRIHTGRAAAESAAAVNARAYTVGEDVVFAHGAYVPEGVSGRRLIAHELAHVLQQRNGSPGLQRDAEAAPGRMRATTGTLDSAVDALRTAAVVVPGLTPLIATLDLLRAVMYFWEHRHEHLRRLLDGIGQTIDTIPDLARQRLAEFLSAAGTAAEAGACVGEQLILLLESLAANWRSVLESFVRDMFFVGLFERSIPNIVDQAGLLFDDIFAGEFRSATDRGVAIMTEVNAILGVLFLWYALITTIVGTAAGSEAPVAGNAVGGAAGLTFAQVVNIGLIASVVGTETARVVRGIDDMVRFWDDVVARDRGCREVAEGVFALALTGALFYFGPRVQTFARSVISRAAVGVRRAVTAATREAAAIAERVTTPALVTPEGLVVPFAGPAPTGPRPVVGGPVRPRPGRAPGTEPARPTRPAPPPAEPAPAPAPAPATPRRARPPAPSEPVTVPAEPAPAPVEPARAPAPDPRPRTATGIEPLPEEPTRRVRCAYPTGLTMSDPIPIAWHKIPSLYPSPLEIGGQQYHRDDPATLPGGEPIGVPSRFWPSRGKIVQLALDRRGSAARDFRAVLELYGFNWGARRYLQADHAQDLQWAAPDGENLDVFNNLWPYDGAGNASAGATQNQTQPVTFCDAPMGPANINVPIQSVKRPGGWGRYFVITRIGLP